MSSLDPVTFFTRAVHDAMYYDLAVWLMLENSAADSVASVYYGLEALIRQLAHLVATYTLALATLLVATIPDFFTILLYVYFISMVWLFVVLNLGPSWLSYIIVIPFLVFGYIRELARDGIRYFLSHAMAKSSRQLMGVINIQDNEAAYGKVALSRSSRQIRILTLRAGCFSSPIECKISVVALDSEENDFEAISYVWGAEKFGSRILVNGFPVIVRPNLFAALRHLRRRDCDRRLWVDALCINQASDEERARQVAQMGDIFGSARRVVVWLGIDSPTTRVFFRRNGESESSAKEVHLGSARAVSKVLSVPWWTRIWVVQEVSLPQDVVIQSGPECITWDRFCTVVDRVMQQECFKKLNKRLHVAEYQSVKALRSQMSPDSLLECQPASYNLLRLIHDFRRREATVPDDKLFALYGLVHDEVDLRAMDLRPHVTYMRSGNTSRWGPSHEFAARCIERFQDLSILALNEAFRPHQRDPSMYEPTWCPSWSSTPNDFATTPFWLGNAGNAKLRWQRRFSASGGLPAPPCRLHESERYIVDETIRVRGWLVDTIDRVGVTPTPSMLWMMGHGFHGMSYRYIVGVFRSRVQWRSALPQWEGMALAACADKDEARRRYHRTITAGLFDSIPVRGGDAYWEVVDQVCPGKCFFITRSGLFGLATAFVKPGQEVWVLMGAAVPMILNADMGAKEPLRTKEYDLDGGFTEVGIGNGKFGLRQYICQAYIDELMVYSGNVKKDISSGKIVAEDVYLN